MRTVDRCECNGKMFEIAVPSSKSIGNRAFVLAALSNGVGTLRGDIDADDVQCMMNSLRFCGVDFAEVSEGVLSVDPSDWRLRGEDLDLFLGNAGTTMRFLTALMCLRKGVTRLSGSERMHERPIGVLVEALVSLGVDIQCHPTDGFPPIRIRSQGQALGGEVELSGSVSSQFISALLMIGPALKGGLTVRLNGGLVSRPYVDITLSMMKQWGIDVRVSNDEFVVQEGVYSSCDYSFEGDASSASYWFAFAALHGCSVTVSNVGAGSLQGDIGFVGILERMGCVVDRSENSFTVNGGDELKGVSVDMVHMPDMVMSLAVVAAVSDGVTEITNIGSLRIKETDRIDATVAELSKFGIEVSCGNDWIRIVGNPGLSIDRSVEVECYADHRMAMSFAILGSLVGNTVILDPGCVSKSYPGFWEELERTVK